MTWYEGTDSKDLEKALDEVVKVVEEYEWKTPSDHSSSKVTEKKYCEGHVMKIR